MNAQSLDSLLAEAAEKIKQEAYAAGWRDAIAAVNRTVSDLADPAATENSELRMDASDPVTVISRSSKARLPKQGSTPWVVLQVVQKKPGMTSPQIVETIQQSGHSAPQGSIRTSIFRMKHRNFIVPRHGKWYPT